MKANQPFSIQGHRGCRGLMPENTLPAFIKAIEMGVNTIELDVAISADKQVVVSHEPWMNHEICFDKNGNEINPLTEMQYNIYRMHYDEVKQFDCGSRMHPHFVHQQKTKAYKPLLSEVIEHVEKYCTTNNLNKIHYNIEIKSLPEGDTIYHPHPAEFCQLVIDVINNSGITNFNLQAFDIRILQFLHAQHPQIKTALLVDNNLPIDDNIQMLGFVPPIYSPHFGLVSESAILFCQKNKMQLIPWTVNDRNDMHELINLGVDGIITDYPDVLINAFK